MFTFLFFIASILIWITSSIGYGMLVVGVFVAIFHFFGFLFMIFFGFFSIGEIVILAKDKVNKKTLMMYILLFILGIAFLISSGVPLKWV